MGGLSVAIMAHPKRERFVEELVPRLPSARVVWDEVNDRWDTGRRALLSADLAADWHLVVQDDAVLCDSFLLGVERALAGVPVGFPVSFYTGRTRPYGPYIKKVVNEAIINQKHWLAMRGPLWGVAVAIPTSIVEQMVNGCDPMYIPNYDMRMAEWFKSRQIPCWYSIPSLVDHRTGPENPSLVHGRGSSSGRTAHRFCITNPLDIDWETGAYFPGDPTEYWTEDHQCLRCLNKFGRLSDVMEHAWANHDLGVVDFLASTSYHRDAMMVTWNRLPPPMRGEFWYVQDKKKRRGLAEKMKLMEDRYMVVGAARDFRYIGNRRGWAIVGGEGN